MPPKKGKGKGKKKGASKKDKPDYDGRDLDKDNKLKEEQAIDLTYNQFHSTNTKLYVLRLERLTKELDDSKRRVYKL